MLYSLCFVPASACRTHAFQQPISYRAYCTRRSDRVSHGVSTSSAEDGTDFRATLAKLQTNFDLADVVVEALEKSQLKNLEEFRFLFDSEAEIGIWTARLKPGDQEQLQVARLRRTWSAVKLFYQHAEQDRSKVQASDLETLLGDAELRDIKAAFWARYRMRFPPEMYPSDATLSRISRELSKRMLCVFSVWKVKSLQFQLVTTSKKRKLSDNLFTEELQEEEPVVQDWENYLGFRSSYCGGRPSCVLCPCCCAGAYLACGHHGDRRGTRFQARSGEHEEFRASG